MIYTNNASKLYNVSRVRNDVMTKPYRAAIQKCFSHTLWRDITKRMRYNRKTWISKYSSAVKSKVALKLALQLGVRGCTYN